MYAFLIWNVRPKNRSRGGARHMARTSLLRRLEQVELALLPAKFNIKGKARIVMERPNWKDMPGEVNLAESFCTRWMRKNGTLFEYVSLHGTQDQLSEEEFENWIAAFPIQREGDRI